VDGEQGFHDPVGGRDAVWFREVPVGGGVGGETVEVVGEGEGVHVGRCLEGGRRTAGIGKMPSSDGQALPDMRSVNFRSKQVSDRER
jgi:hypothetical protein